MSKTNPYFIDIDIEPADPRHRQIIAAAIRANDTDALTALRGNTHKPIRFVVNTFMYFLMLTSWEGNDDSGYVVIYSIEARQALTKLANLQLEREGVYAGSDNYQATIPLDTYDFLL